MIYIIISVIVLAFIFLMMLCFRLRLELSDEVKNVFLGLGRSGIEYDIISNQSYLFLAGMRIKKITISTTKKKKKKKPKKKKPPKYRSVGDILNVIPKTTKAFFKYILNLLGATNVEILKGTIKAGFDSPDITGQMFGYYMALSSAAPKIGNSLVYIPVWEERTFEASLQASIAIPQYKLIYQTIIFIINLPLRELIKLAIGKKERRP